jgi:hypothetical protein
LHNEILIKKEIKEVVERQERELKEVNAELKEVSAELKELKAQFAKLINNPRSSI